MDNTSSDEQVINAVRNRTLRDETILPDEKILELAGRSPYFPNMSNLYGDALDEYGIVADCWEYVAASIPFHSESVGGAAYSQPTAFSLAAYYRSLSRKASSGAGGAGVQIRTIQRADLLPAPMLSLGVEHGCRDAS